MTLLGQKDLMAFLIQREVTRLGDALAGARIFLAFLFGQGWHHLVHGDVELGVVFSLAADDQGSARLVNQDRVNLVDDRIVQSTLNPVSNLIDHVVAQVVKAVFVVRPVGDVCPVGGLLFLASHLRQIDADAQAQKVVKLAHPLGVAIGQIVIDGDDVNAFASQGVEIDRHGRGQGLAFAGSHF